MRKEVSSGWRTADGEREHRIAIHLSHTFAVLTYEFVAHAVPMFFTVRRPPSAIHGSESCHVA